MLRGLVLSCVLAGCPSPSISCSPSAPTSFVRPSFQPGFALVVSRFFPYPTFFFLPVCGQSGLFPAKHTHSVEAAPSDPPKFELFSARSDSYLYTGPPPSLRQFILPLLLLLLALVQHLNRTCNGVIHRPSLVLLRALAIQLSQAGHHRFSAACPPTGIFPSSSSASPTSRPSLRPFNLEAVSPTLQPRNN
jgi:hypothetical protein